MQNEQTMKNIEVQIVRINLNGTNNLQNLSNTNEIVDINEIYKIHIYGDIDEDINELYNQMPKSHKWRKNIMLCGPGVSKPIISVEFNTFSMNDVTGDKNESAIKRRAKVIQKLNQIGL